MRMSTRHLSSMLLSFSAAATVVNAGAPIAGTDPSQRPVHAPSITVVDHSGQWYIDALHGVTRPYPYSLRFLEDQGNWYTPFARPGMPGRYDIRGWHQR